MIYNGWAWAVPLIAHGLKFWNDLSQLIYCNFTKYFCKTRLGKMDFLAILERVHCSSACHLHRDFLSVGQHFRLVCFVFNFPFIELNRFLYHLYLPRSRCSSSLLHSLLGPGDANNMKSLVYLLFNFTLPSKLYSGLARRDRPVLVP